MSHTGRLVAAACTVGALGLLGTKDVALSYEPATHQVIGRTAFDRSNLDAVLKIQYRLERGVTSVINGETVQAWIEIGARREDFPAIRVLNHFHNPLKLWDSAGGLFGQSSIYWQQNPDQGLGGTWSWPTARQGLLKFLTSPTPAARMQALADTARALGQTMHVVQDAASPAHTRDDPHLIRDGYEARIEELRSSRDTALRSRFDAFLATPSDLPQSSSFALTDNPRAPVPVARLIDSDRFSGTVQSYVTGAQAGLAEYTSGGYVSDDTIFSGFALPRRESLGTAVFDPPAGAPGARRYFPKTTDGDAIGHFVAEGTLYERLFFRGQLFGGFILDDRVYEDYAAQLIPRAAAYSAALLNYFFRSNFDFTVSVNTTDPARRVLKITVPPQLTAETMDGTFTLYADDQNGLRGAVAGATITEALPRGAEAQVSFTPVSGVSAYVLVFAGKMGDEEGAVTGKVKPTGAIVSAIQATAELTGGEQRTTVTETDNASTLVLVERRSKDARQQRATGTFFSPASEPGRHLKRVALEFDARVVGAPAAQLLLDGVDVGRAWLREASVVDNPSRWEIRIDLPAFFGGAGGLVPNVPRFLTVETLEGIKVSTPLLWWRSLASLAEARALAQVVTPCPPELQCEEVISSSTLLGGLVFFGDGNGEGRDTTASGQRPPLTAAHTSVGFTPIGAVAGYAVGATEQSGEPTCFAGCVPSASCSSSTVSVFAQSGASGLSWNKDEFSVSLANLVGVRKPANACTRPTAGQPAAPDLPALRFRRDYLPAEQSRFQEFGVTPPEHEISLR